MPGAMRSCHVHLGASSFLAFLGLHRLIGFVNYIQTVTLSMYLNPQRYLYVLDVAHQELIDFPSIVYEELHVDLNLGLGRNHASDGVKASNYSLLFVLLFPIKLGRDIPVVREHYVPFTALCLNLLRDTSIDAAQLNCLFV